MAARAVTHRSLFLPLLAALTGFAWLLLFLVENSPYALFLNHSVMREVCLAAGSLGVLNLYVLGWVLMVAAMMLPTTFPLLEMFRRLTLARPDQGLLMALLVAGYVAVWLAFGVAAHAGVWLLLAGVDRVEALSANAWALGAGALALAGAFQFSALKYRCLEQCRTPLSFVIQHWLRQDGRLGAFMLGVRHGAFCVGCCWALMLLMFVVAAGNVGWMLAIGAVMAIEKNLPWGRRLSAPLGIALLTWAGLIALDRLSA